MIRYFENGGWPREAFFVYSNGQSSIFPDMVTHGRGTCVEFVCDTLEEVEKLRLLIEQRREEREALERKWELRLAEEVER